MKFIHCADLHLDSRIDTLPTEKSKIRREEIIRSFEKLAAYATDNGVTAVIIAGDMFDGKKVSAKTKGRVVAAVKNNPAVDFLYLSGNHDESDVFSEEELPANLKRFADKWTSYRYGNTAITGATSGENPEFLYGSLSLAENDINIVVLHGQVAGYKSEDKAEIISLPLLKDKNIDYLALGHIHYYSENKLDDRGVYAYSGCLDGRGFDETGEKGFVLLETDEKTVSRRFVGFSSREFFETEMSVNGMENWYMFREEAVKFLKKNYPSSSLIKITLTGSRRTDFEIDAEGLESRLLEEFFFVKIYDKTALEISEEDFKNDKSVRGEFMRLVKNSDLSEEEKTAVITLGLNALKGEDIR